MMALFTHCRTHCFGVVSARETEPAGADNVGLAGGIGRALSSMSMTEVVLVIPPPPAFVSSVISCLRQMPESTASPLKNKILIWQN